MDRVVGNRDCNFTDVCNALHESPCVTLLYQKWKDFARRLSVPEGIIYRLESRNHGYACFSTIYEVLVAWRGYKAEDASLFELIKSLKNCGLNDAADKLGSQLHNFSSQPTSNKLFCRSLSGFLQFVNSTNAIAIICTPLPEVTYSRIIETTSASITISKLVKDEDYTLSEVKSAGMKSVTIVRTENTSDFLQIWGKNNTKLVILTEETKADLKRKFFIKEDLIILSDNIKWSDLAFSYQNELLKNFDLLQRVDAQFLEINMNGQLLFSLMGSPTSKTFNDHLPIPVGYYISRRLSSKHAIPTRASEFRIPSAKDIYIFSGIPENELLTLTGTTQLETSSNLLLKKEKITGRCILLDVESDFEKLSTLTEKALHWFEGHKVQEEWEIIWKTSIGSTYGIHQYIQCSEYNEDQFLDLIQTTGKHVCIIAESGMGKSMLIANICGQLKSKQIVIYITASDFVRVISSRPVILNVETIADIICNVVPCNPADKLILQRLVESEAEPIEIFFEDVDELSPEDTEILHTYFHYINDSCTSIRLWFTAKQHLSKKLEIELALSTYELAPFNANEQNKLFISFWRHKEANACVRKLGTFRNKLDRLNNITTTTKIGKDGEKCEFIPLRCFLIASIYQDDAIEFATSEYMKPMSTILDESVASVYEKMVEISFKIFTDKHTHLSLTDLYNVHTHRSLQLLFPQWLHRLNKYFPCNQNLDDNEIINVGILQSVGPNSVPKFIHKTFAEYFVSKFIINRFRKNCSETVIDFFLLEILKNRPSKVPIVYYSKCQIHGLTAAAFERNFMCYLVEKYAQKYHLIELDINVPVVLRNDAVKQLALACAFRNHFPLFKVLKATNVFAFLQSYVYDQHMLYVLARFGDLSFFGFALKVFRRLTETRAQQAIDLAENRSRIEQFRIKVFLNLLRIAGSRGHYDIFSYLFSKEEFISWFKAPNKTLIIHACVQNSLSDSEDVIADKIRIIAGMYKVRSDIISEKDKEGQSAILCTNVHVELLIKLVKLNSILEGDGEMLLHNVLNYLSQYDYHLLVKKIPKDILENLLQKKNSSGQTPLQTAVCFTNPHVKVLNSFAGLNADFNNVDESGDCILSVAIRNEKFTNLDILVEHGAKLDRINKNGDSLLHIACASSNMYAIEYILQEKERRDRINDINNNHETPLHIAVSSQNHQAPQIVSYLIRKNADMSIRDKLGDNALKSALKKGLLETVEILFAEHYRTHISDNNFAAKTIYFSAEFSSLDILKFVCDQFCKAKPDVALADVDLGQEKFSLLHAAVNNKHFKEIATYFLESHGFKKVLHRPEMLTVLPELSKCGVDGFLQHKL